MNINEQQGHWILQSNLLPRETVDQAWQATQASPWLDLCGVLESWGRLTPEQAQHIRHATQSKSSPSSAAPVAPVMPTPVISPNSSSQMMAPPMSASMQNASMELMHSFESIETLGLPDYHIDRELGRGGMGVVWLGRHKESLDKVVIKAVLESKKSEVGLKRFAREASILARIKHPNVVSIRDYDAINEQLPYLVMEFVDGQDLKSYVKESLRVESNVPPLEWTLEIFTKLARALTACHEVGALHRDLKPANILIESETDRPVICDFGLARANTEQLKNEMSQWESLTQSGQIVGTPSFMPPEQLDSNKDYGELGAKCDVWGLGATLFYCLTGEPPYKGLSMVNLVKAHMAGEPRRLRDLKPETPPWLDQLCADMLLRDSRRRPTMEDVAECIENEESFHSPEVSSSLRYVIGAALLLVVLIGLGVGALVATAPTPRFKLSASAEGQFFEDKQEDELEIWTKDGQVTLKLDVLEGRWVQSVVTRGHTYTDISDNQASLTLSAKTDEERIDIKVVDGFGNESQTRSILVHKDKEAPTITLDPLAAIESDRQVVTGSLSEICRSVSIAGVKATLTGTRFRVDLPLKDMSARKLEVTAEDRAGNSGVLGLPIYVLQAPDSRTPLEKTLLKVKDGARLVLLPGDYKMPGQIGRNVEIYGVRDVVLNIEDPGFEVAGVDVSVRGCVIACRSEAEKSFVTMTRGRLEFEDCSFRISGATRPLLMEVKGPKRGLGIPPELVLRRCQFKFPKGMTKGFLLENTVLNIEQCGFSSKLDAELRPKRRESLFDLDRGTFVQCVSTTFDGGQMLVGMANTRAIFRRSFFKNALGFAIFCNASNIRLDDCNFDSNRRGALALNYMTRGEVTQCRFRDNGEAQVQAAIMLGNRSQCRFDDCQISGSQPRGIYARGGSMVAMSRCQLTNNGGGPLILEKSSRGRLSQCEIDEKEAYRVIVGGGSVLTFEDSQFLAKVPGVFESENQGRFVVTRCQKLSKIEESFQGSASPNVMSWREPKRFAGTKVGTYIIDSTGNGDFTTFRGALQHLRSKQPTIAMPRLIVRKGVYNESITINDDVEIRAEGALGEVQLVATESRLILIQDADVRLVGLTLKKGATRYANATIKIQGRGSLDIERCVITSKDGACLSISGAYRRAEFSNIPSNIAAPKPLLYIRDSELRPSGYGGAMIYDAIAILENTSVIDDRAEGPNKRPNVAIKSGGYGRLKNCKIINSRIFGVHLENGRVNLDSCLVSESASEGVYLGPGDARMFKCIITKNKLQGLTVSPESKVLVDHCRIFGNGEMR